MGDPQASDAAIMEWARRGGHVVFTHDLDFSALLAATQASAPSVIQVRAQDVLPDAIGADVLHVLRTRATAIEEGAVVTIDKAGSRVRILPIHGRPARPSRPRSRRRSR